MTSSCPPEGDPRLRVEGFVKDPSERTLAGLREAGPYALMDVLREEILRQTPDVNIVRIDTDVLADNGVDLGRELEEFLEGTMAPGENVLMFYDQPTIIKWQEHVEAFMGSGKHKVRIFFAGLGCRNVPICCKLL